MDALLTPAGPLARELAGIGLWLSVGALVLFGAVMAVLAGALLRQDPQASATRWIAGGGVLLPALLLPPLFVWRLVVAARVQAPPPAPALQVSVIGRMWWWEVRYRDPETGRERVTANEIRIPAGRPVRLALSSPDVIHGFWVPALGGKRDLTPGRVEHLVIQADRPGVHRGRCAEYCGEQHARMALAVVVQPEADFRRWLALQGEAAPPAAGDERLERGRQAFVDHGCVACHRIAGLGGGGTPTVGPDLTHVAGRASLGAGEHAGRANDAAALRDWIANVQRIKPGAHMPSFDHLDAATLDALAAYLAGLT